MDKLISILIPTFNQINLFEKIVGLYSYHPKVTIIVSDDSDDVKIKEKIKATCYLKKILYFQGPQKSAVDNWNFLLKKVDTPFFVLNHHDEFPNNLLYLDYLDHLDKNKTGLLLLACTSYLNNKPYMRLSSRNQKIHFAFFKNFPNATINLFLAPTASVIVNSKLKKNNFDKDLNWYVDCEWYYKLLSSISLYKLNIIFFKDSRIISKQTNHSITYKIKNKLKNIKKYEIIKLKKKKLVPNKLTALIQKVVSLLISFNSKIIRLISIIY